MIFIIVLEYYNHSWYCSVTSSNDFVTFCIWYWLFYPHLTNFIPSYKFSLNKLLTPDAGRDWPPTYASRQRVYSVHCKVIEFLSSAIYGEWPGGPPLSPFLLFEHSGSSIPRDSRVKSRTRFRSPGYLREMNAACAADHSYKTKICIQCLFALDITPITRYKTIQDWVWTLLHNIEYLVREFHNVCEATFIWFLLGFIVVLLIRIYIFN